MTKKSAPKGKTSGTRAKAKSTSKPKSKAAAKAKVATAAPTAVAATAATPAPVTTAAVLPKTEGAAFSLAQLPYDDIEIHPDLVNCREPGTPTDDLEEGISELGLETPLTVWKQQDDAGEDRYYLLSGWRRHEALRNLRAGTPGSFETVPVSIFEGSLQEALLHNISENAQRLDPNAVEYGEAILRLIENSGGALTQARVAEQLGKSTAWVSVVVKFAKGPEEGVTKQLREAIQSGLIGFSMGRIVAGKPTNVQVQFVRACEKARLAGDPKPGSDELDEIEGNKPKPKQKSRSINTILLRVEEYEQTDTTEMEDAMRLLRPSLSQEQLTQIRSVLKLAHHYGQLKALIWASGKEIDWKKARPPFEVAPVEPDDEEEAPVAATFAAPTAAAASVEPDEEVEEESEEAA